MEIGRSVRWSVYNSVHDSVRYSVNIEALELVSLSTYVWIRDSVNNIRLWIQVSRLSGKQIIQLWFQ